MQDSTIPLGSPDTIYVCTCGVYARALSLRPGAESKFNGVSTLAAAPPKVQASPQSSLLGRTQHNNTTLLMRGAPARSDISSRLHAQTAITGSAHLAPSRTAMPPPGSSWARGLAHRCWRRHLRAARPSGLAARQPPRTALVSRQPCHAALPPLGPTGDSLRPHPGALHSPMRVASPGSRVVGLAGGRALSLGSAAVLPWATVAPRACQCAATRHARLAARVGVGCRPP